MDTFKQSILIVDSEISITDILVKQLLGLDYEIFLATNGVDALAIFNKENINLIILDILLPKLDGYEICYQIRKNSSIPIIILTALNDLRIRLMGLELGINDFIAKPFSLKELIIRISYNLHRSNYQKFKTLPTRQEIFYFGDLTVNLTKQEVLKVNKKLILTRIEFSLLQLLIQNAGRKLSRVTILNNIWGYTPQRNIDTRVVDVHVHRLRSKIEEQPRIPYFILTVRGIGYMFQPLN